MKDTLKALALFLVLAFLFAFFMFLGGCSAEHANTSVYDPTPSERLNKPGRDLAVQAGWTTIQFEKDLDECEPKPVLSFSVMNDGAVTHWYEQRLPAGKIVSWTVVKIKDRKIVMVVRLTVPLKSTTLS